MALPLFPIGSPTSGITGGQPVRAAGWIVKRTPQFNTIVQQSPSGARVAVPLYPNNPLWEFEFTYEYIDGRPPSTNPNPYYPAVIPYSDLQILQAFYLWAKGRSNEFVFMPPDAVQTTVSLLNPDANNNVELTHLIGGVPNLPTANPTTFFATISESVQELNGGSLTVFANGVNAGGTFTQQPANTISPYEGIVIAFGGSTPTPPITATFTYFYRVAFGDDSLSFEDFMFQLTRLGSLKLQQVRVAP